MKFLARIALVALMPVTSALFMFAPSAFAASCDALHPCPAGQACNVSGTCVAVQGASGGTDTQGGTGLINPLGTTSLPQLITDILQLVVKIGAVIVVFMLVYVGFLFVVAQGSENKLEEAKRALLYTIIGALILLGAEAIAQGIQATVSALSG